MAGVFGQVRTFDVGTVHEVRVENLSEQVEHNRRPSAVIREWKDLGTNVHNGGRKTTSNGLSGEHKGRPTGPKVT